MNNELSPRELEVLRLVALGLKNHEIASKVALSPKSIEHMLGSADPYRAIYPKIGVSNRTEAASWYAKHFGEERLSNDSYIPIGQLLGVYTDYVARIYAARTGGQPLLALDMAKFLKEQLLLALPGAGVIREAFHRLYAATLAEETMLYLESSPRTEVLGLLLPVYGEIQRVAKELEDRQISGLGYLALAGAYNIDKQYAAGQKLYLTALDLCGTVDMQLRALRGIAISSAFLSELSLVEFASVETHRRIEEGHFTKLEQVCETVEGVSKAHGILRLADTHLWLEKAEEFIGKLDHHPLRRLQLMVSKLETLGRLEPRSLNEIETLGAQGIALARAYGYPRHQELIGDIIARLTRQ